jgi:FkbM family methyltransferase
MYRTLVNLSRKILHPMGYDLVRFDPDLTCSSHLLRVFDLLKIDTVWDVGANEGQYSRILREVGYRGQIESFEPSPDALKRLKEEASGDSSWRVWPCALGAKAEKREFLQFGSSVLNSFHAPSAEGLSRFKMMNQPSSVSVELRTGDQVWDEIYCESDPRMFLKIDTQGHDRDVLRGLEGHLDQILGIQLELSLVQIYEGSENYIKTLEWLTQAGFELTSLYPLVRAKGLRLLEVDCIAVRKGIL